MSSYAFGGLIAALLVYAVVTWRTRKADRLVAQAVPRLEAFRETLDQERRRQSEERASGASNLSIHAGLEQLDDALRCFSYGNFGGGGQGMTHLAGLAEREWHAESELGREAAALGELARSTHRQQTAIRATLRQRPANRARHD